MSKKALMNNVYKNYIFDFYGTLVDILTDEKDPALWDKLAQLYQAYGAVIRVKVLENLMLSVWHWLVRS